MCTNKYLSPDRVVIPTNAPTFNYARKKRSVASQKDLFLDELTRLTSSPRLTKVMRRSLIARVKEAREEAERRKREAESSPRVTMKKRRSAKHKVCRTVSQFFYY